MRGFSFLVALAALISAPSTSVAQSAPLQDFTGSDSAKPVVIYVARRDWHVDIGFATADLSPPLASLATEFPGVRFLFFGFGDRRYLLAKNRNVAVLLAALWPGRGMIMATGLTSPPQDAFGAAHVIALRVTASQARDAQAFIWKSLNEHQSDATGHDDGSLYFAATPKYSAVHTCNTWAAETLAAGALPAHSAGVVFAGELWIQVRRLEKKRLENLSTSLTPAPVLHLLFLSTTFWRLPKRQNVRVSSNK